jgi:hypothetical protein
LEDVNSREAGIASELENTSDIESAGERTKVAESGKSEERQNKFVALK